MSADSLESIVKAYDIRGVVPEEFDVATATALGAAFAEVVVLAEGASGLVVGHDMRPSSPELAQAFASGAASAGVAVTTIGLCSTDGLYFASGHLDVPGAMFTASHNPAQYNGIKLCRAGARPISLETGLAAVRDRAAELLNDGHEVSAGTPGPTHRDDMLAEYARFLRELVPLDDIAHLRVVVDAANGMAGLTVPSVLGTAAGLPMLPLDVVPLYFELDGTFPNHEANPLEPDNLRDLQAAVVEHRADLGLAFDGDADRCFVVDERGEPVNPSAITALIAGREIERGIAAGRQPEDIAIVHNVITSRAVPEMVGERGARAVRTRVGHSFIKETMAKENAAFGGEHSAHYYFRDFWFADTGMLAAMHVLAALGSSGADLSELIAGQAPYVASGEINSRVADVAATTARVQAWAEEQGAELDHLDGLTAGIEGSAEEPMWWFSVRPSNTEPLLRLNVEAADQATMERVRDDVLGMIRRPEGDAHERTRS